MSPDAKPSGAQPSGLNELVVRILRCPDCDGNLEPDLACAGCGRSFAPAADGIISALPSGLRAPAGNKEQLQAAIDAAEPKQHDQGVVLYEQAFHDEQASYYDSLFADPLPLRTYYKRLVRVQIYEFVRNAPFMVDLCCGTGKSSGPLIDRGMTVVGMDVSREMLRVYRKKYPGPANPILIHADASRPPLRGSSCEALSMIGGLHHIPDREGSLQSCCDALARGGVLILHEPLKTGQKSALAGFLENVYVITDPVRMWAALRRRVGLKNGAPAKDAAPPVVDFTPYERPFSSTAELVDAMPREMRMLALRSQGVLSFRQFAPYLQSSPGQPLSEVIVRLDEWLSSKSSRAAGDALFAVFRKDVA